MRSILSETHHEAKVTVSGWALIGLVEDELPGYYARKKGDNSDDMREERRNCFVAITRAEETLALSFADKYFGWAKEPSRFLAEMGLQEK